MKLSPTTNLSAIRAELAAISRATIVHQPPRPRHASRASAVKCRCVETGKVYLCVLDAGRDTLIDTGRIYRSMATRHAANGFHWERVGNATGKV